jgi:hypothetical protein
MRTAEQRRAAVDTILANAPQVHPGAVSAQGEVWSTVRDCYVFLAENCAPGSRTLETGLGVSTVLFAAWGTEHICVVPDAEQVQKTLDYCGENGIDTGKLRFEVAPSDQALPGLELPPLDAVLVDGNHGFPSPIIDWYYAGSRLRRGGLIVFDDIQLPHVQLGLLHFLDADPRWSRVAMTDKWVAYRKERDGPLYDRHVDQRFLYRAWRTRGFVARVRRVAKEGPIRAVRRKYGSR